MKNSFYLLLLISGILFTGCDKEEIIQDSSDYSAELSNIGSNVILETYKQLAAASADLLTATQKLQDDPTAQNLEDAQNAWKNTRSYWEQSEGFLFGPVDQEGIDPAIDSWPLDVATLNNMLSSSNNLTVDFLSHQEDNVKGFHVIEYLLWGENGQKTIDQFTTREFEYLSASTGLLAKDTKKLYNLWDPAQGNFIKNILTAGNGSNLYISQKSALEEIATALANIADEVANGKIEDPFTQQNITLEESRFSSNSKEDFANNIRSIQNIYSGNFLTTGNGKGLSAIVKNINPNLDQTITNQIKDAIQAILDINGTFSEAVTNQDQSVRTAQEKIRDLQSTLEESLIPLINNL